MSDAGLFATAICPLKPLPSGFGASMLKPPMPGAIDGRAVINGAKGDWKRTELLALRCVQNQIIDSVDIDTCRPSSEGITFDCIAKLTEGRCINAGFRLQRSFPELGVCLVIVALDNLVNGLAHFVELSPLLF